MSLAEIKREIGKLNAQEHEDLENYLRQLRRWKSPARQAELAQIMRDMDEGKKHSEQEVAALHQRLVEEGR